MSESSKTTFRCGSIAGAMLSIAIILIRAFQTNAEPMSAWSKMSWVWMTMPWWLPTAIGVVLLLLASVGWIWVNARSRW